MQIQRIVILGLLFIFIGCAAKPKAPLHAQENRSPRISMAPSGECNVFEELFFARDVKICEDERESIVEVIYYNGGAKPGNEIGRAWNIALRPKEKEIDRYGYRGRIIVALRMPGGGYCIGEPGIIPTIETYSDPAGNELGLLVLLGGQCAPMKYPNPWSAGSPKQTSALPDDGVGGYLMWICPLLQFL